MNYDQDTLDFIRAIQEYQLELDAYDDDLWIKMAIYRVWDKLNLHVEEDTLLLAAWIEQ